MTGLLQWEDSGTGKRRLGVKLEEVTILHMRFLRVGVLRGVNTPEAVLRRRVRAAAKGLHRAGVVQAVLPSLFPYGDQMEKWGVRPASTLSLRQALAADWTRETLAEKGVPLPAARVAVSAVQLTGQVVRTVTELSLGCRYVQLDLPRGGGELCRQLRREYGVSLLLEPSRERLTEADVRVCFDPPEEVGPSGPTVLALYDEAQALPPLVLPPALEEQLPIGADRPQLLAVLREAGALRPGQIALGRREEREELA